MFPSLANHPRKEKSKYQHYYLSTSEENEREKKHDDEDRKMPTEKTSPSTHGKITLLHFYFLSLPRKKSVGEESDIYVFCAPHLFLML